MLKAIKLATAALVTTMFVAGMSGAPAQARNNNAAAMNALAAQMYAQQQAAAVNVAYGTQPYQAQQAAIASTLYSMPPAAQQAYMNKLATQYWGAVNSGTYNPYTTQFDYTPTNLGLYANPYTSPYGYPYGY